MNRTRLAAIVLAILGVAVAVWFVAGRRHHAAAPKPTAPVASGSGTAAPTRAAPERDRPGAAPFLSRDADPAGPMLLEGSVLDEHDQPVAGAEVWLSSAPPRRTKTDTDGSFSFDKLLGRTYNLGAHAGDRVGGPVSTRVGPDTEPVVIRLRPGAAVKVTVHDASGARPIAGAAVTLATMFEPTAVTDADGVASFAGVEDGWLTVTASAPGYAPGAGNAMIGKTQRQVDIAVELHAGASVAGVVVDDRGQPVAEARVWAKDASSWQGAGDRAAVTTDAQGQFTIPAVAPGSYRLVAIDDKHAPGQSELVTVGRDGATGVRVVMAAAARVSGTVFTADSQRAAFATVRIASTTWGDGAVSRQATADDHGDFVIEALPRQALRLRAESEVATSKIVDVDLAANPDRKDVKLVLEQAGTIAGVVVDSAGEPVAEAAVSAVPDFMSGDLAAGDLMLASSSAATTDGGGRFTLRGLADGAYRLAASREGAAERTAWGKDAVTARTGATDVRLVLPAPGGVRGKLVLAAGGAPSLAIVSSGWEHRITTRDGTFELGSMTPGKYDIKITGPDFAEVNRGDVEIKDGQVTDLGTITVTGGRSISGRVVDAKGAPIADARVVFGRMLFGDGKGLARDEDDTNGQAGMRSARTAADGTFKVRGVGLGPGALLAEHATAGRSVAIDIPRGAADITDVKLTLRGFGALTGTVTRKGAPVANATIGVTPAGSRAQSVFVQTGADGRFVVERVPEGENRVQVSISAGMSSTSASRMVTVVVGKTTDASLVVPVGTLKLTVDIKPEPGANITAALVVLVRGSFAARNGQDVLDAAVGAVPVDSGGLRGLAPWFPPAAIPTWSELEEGAYTLCGVPISGNILDQSVNQRAFENMDKLKVACKAATLAAAPAEQTVTLVLPQQVELPAPGSEPDAGVP